MKIKHKVIKEFQFLSNDKKIFILKVGTILQEYCYIIKNESIPIDKEIIESNPDFFELVDWKTEFLIHLKLNKISPPAQISKKIIPFIEELLLTSSSSSSVQIQTVVDEEQIKRLQRLEETYKNDLKELEKREEDFNEKVLISEANLSKKEEELSLKEEELNKLQEELNNLNNQISEWETTHWKFKRNM